MARVTLHTRQNIKLNQDLCVELVPIVFCSLVMATVIWLQNSGYIGVAI